MARTTTPPELSPPHAGAVGTAAMGGRILGEVLVQDRRPRARQTEDEHRLFNPTLGDLGMALVRIHHA